MHQFMPCCCQQRLWKLTGAGTLGRRTPTCFSRATVSLASSRGWRYFLLNRCFTMAGCARKLPSHTRCTAETNERDLETQWAHGSRMLHHRTGCVIGPHCRLGQLAPASPARTASAPWLCSVYLLLSKSPACSSCCAPAGPAAPCCVPGGAAAATATSTAATASSAAVVMVTMPPLLPGPCQLAAVEIYVEMGDALAAVAYDWPRPCLRAMTERSGA
jgi:hypothetical protein